MENVPALNTKIMESVKSLKELHDETYENDARKQVLIFIKKDHHYYTFTFQYIIRDISELFSRICSRTVSVNETAKLLKSRCKENETVYDGTCYQFYEQCVGREIPETILLDGIYVSKQHEDNYNKDVHDKLKGRIFYFPKSLYVDENRMNWLQTIAWIIQLQAHERFHETYENKVGEIRVVSQRSGSPLCIASELAATAREIHALYQFILNYLIPNQFLFLYKPISLCLNIKECDWYVQNRYSY